MFVHFWAPKAHSSLARWEFSAGCCLWSCAQMKGQVPTRYPRPLPLPVGILSTGAVPLPNPELTAPPATSHYAQQRRPDSAAALQRPLACRCAHCPALFFPAPSRHHTVPATLASSSSSPALRYAPSLVISRPSPPHLKHRGPHLDHVCFIGWS